MNDNNSIQYNYITTKPTLTPIVLNSATMLNASGDLEVSYTNPNSITVQGDFNIDYDIGDTGGGLDCSNGISLTSGTHTFTTNTVNAKGNIYCAKCYADGYNDSVSSNVVSYSAYIKTLIILGATSVDVGSTANLYAYDETDDPEHNTPLIGVSWSSTGTYATIDSSTGVVTGISDGAETITATKPGYTQGTYNIRVNGVSSMLSPSITNVSTTTHEIDNEGRTETETILNFRVENINGFDVDCVSSAVVGDDDVSMGSSSGTCEGDYWLDISLSVPGDYSGITGLITVTFSKPGYNNAVFTKDFTVSLKTLIILGATSVDVGSTANLYAYDETDDPEHNTPLIGVSWSSTGTYATIDSSTGVVTGISDGAETITATKPGYTQGTYNIRVNGVSSMLSPSITNVSTTTHEIDNEGRTETETILNFRVENINGFDVDCVSSAVVSDYDISMGSSSGTCEGDYWLDISLSTIGDHSGRSGLITVTFSKPGYNNAVSTKDFTVSQNMLIVNNYKKEQLQWISYFMSV